MLAQANPMWAQVGHVATGLAWLAVVAYIVKSMADDLGGEAAVYGFFQEMLREFPATPLRAAPYVAVPVLAVIAAYRVMIGLKGPFPRDPAKLGGSVMWVVALAGLWLWGAFIPPAWGAGDFGEAVNFGLRCLYLLGIVENIVWIVLMIYRPTPRGPEPVRENIQQQKFRW